jgi:hypothetical protein
MDSTMNDAAEAPAALVDEAAAAVEALVAPPSAIGAALAVAAPAGEDGGEVEAMLASYVAGGLTALSCPRAVGHCPALFTKGLVAYGAALRRVAAALATRGGWPPAVALAALRAACRSRHAQLAERLAAAIRPALRSTVG